MKIIDISKQAVKRIGRNYIGNIYLYRWTVFIEDNRKEDYGLQQQTMEGSINIKPVFTDTKPKVKRWLKDNGLEWDFKKRGN